MSTEVPASTAIGDSSGRKAWFQFVPGSSFESSMPGASVARNQPENPQRMPARAVVKWAWPETSALDVVARSVEITVADHPRTPAVSTFATETAFAAKPASGEG